MGIEKEVEKLESLVSEIKVDAEKFNKGNSAAGTRVRKSLMAVKNLCHETRAIISEIKSAE